MNFKILAMVALTCSLSMASGHKFIGNEYNIMEEDEWGYDDGFGDVMSYFKSSSKLPSRLDLIDDSTTGISSTYLFDANGQNIGWVYGAHKNLFMPSSEEFSIERNANGLPVICVMRDTDIHDGDLFEGISTTEYVYDEDVPVSAVRTDSDFVNGVLYEAGEPETYLFETTFTDAGRVKSIIIRFSDTIGDTSWYETLHYKWSDDKLLSKTIISSYDSTILRFAYDASGRKVSEKIITYQDKIGSNWTHTYHELYTYIYNSDGHYDKIIYDQSNDDKNIDEINSSENQVFHFSYDDNGRLLGITVDNFGDINEYQFVASYEATTPLLHSLYKDDWNSKNWAVVLDDLSKTRVAFNSPKKGIGAVCIEELDKTSNFGDQKAIKAVDVTIHGDINFSLADLTISFADKNLVFDEDYELGIFCLQDGKWEYVGGVVDSSNQTITTQVTHFSTYGVFAMPKGTAVLPENSIKNNLTPKFSFAMRSGSPVFSIANPRTGFTKLSIFDIHGKLITSSNMFVTSSNRKIEMNTNTRLSSGQYIAVINNGSMTLKHLFVNQR